MRKIILIGLTFLFSIATTIAQDNLWPVYEIKSDTAVADTLPNAYWQMLEHQDA